MPGDRSRPTLPVYVVETGRRIAPFDESVGEAMIGNRSLAQLQEETLRDLGCECRRVEALPATLELPCLVTFDHVYFSYVLLEQFIERAVERAKNATLSFERLGALGKTSALMGLREQTDDHGRTLDRLDLFFLVDDQLGSSRSAEPLIERLHETSTPLVVPRRELTHRIRMPKVPGSDEDSVEIPITARVGGHVQHWIHILRLSQMHIGVATWDYVRNNRRKVRRHGFRTFLRMLFVERRWSRSGYLASFFGGLNVIEEGVKIHPTAQIRGSFIGRDARIGAGAIIRNSIIGAEATVADDACVNHSVIGDRSLVLRDTYMCACVSYPDATISNYKVQLSLFGRGAFLTASAALIDAKFNGSVRVEHEGQLADTGTSFLGVCLGHGVTIGAHVTVQSGRAIPNGYEIVTPPELVLSKVPSDLPKSEPLVVRNGTLEPLRRPQ